MALKSSGKMTLGGAVATEAVAAELNKNPTALITLNDTDVRTLVGIPSGRIRFPLDFYGKSFATIIPPISSNSTALTLTPADVPGYVAGQARVQLNLASATYLYCGSGTGALIISGFTTGDQVTIVNNGYIMGCGGNGGMADLTNPTAGGPAIVTSCDLIIENNGYIAGGGGGGGTPTWDAGQFTIASGGGGAGGGTGGTVGQNVGITTKFPGGAGGSPGQKGGDGTLNLLGSPNNSYYASGGGGGRIIPGARSDYYNGTASGTFVGYGGEAGGGGGVYTKTTNFYSSYGGAGGEPGGPSNGEIVYLGGGGGGWGASGANANFGPFWTTPIPSNDPLQTSYSNYYGAAGGKAIELNGHSVTWVGGFNSSRVFGAVS